MDLRRFMLELETVKPHSDTLRQRSAEDPVRIRSRERARYGSCFGGFRRTYNHLSLLLFPHLAEMRPTHNSTDPHSVSGRLAA